MVITHELVEWVSYPGLEDHPSYDRVKEYFEPRAKGGPILGLGAKVDRKFLKNLSIVVN